MRIYHNPRCSKSRETLALIKERGVYPEIIKYLEHPITIIELENLISLLDINPIDLVRRNESIWKQKFKSKKLNKKALLQVMVDYPKLIERPIVVNKKRAVLGRPPENVLKILD